MEAPDRESDQARRPIFRWLMVLQLLAAAFFGVVPFLAPAAFASLSGMSGREFLIYRLAGAASTGYAVAALLSLTRRPPWSELRIPMVATLTFTAGAAIGSVLALIAGVVTPMILFVLVAATAFALLAGYWLRRDEGPPAADHPSLKPAARTILSLAALSAASFGLLPLIAPEPFADIFGLDTTDGWIYRMAGAACFGYATAGIRQVRARAYPEIRVQNGAAITFNALGALAALLALASGQGGLLAPVILVAAGAFTVLLIVIAVRTRSQASSG